MLVLTRAVVKQAMMVVLPLVLPSSDAPPAKRFAVEIPTKVVTYTAVGLVAASLAPAVFLKYGI